MGNGGFGSFRHLAVRFFGALDPRGPSPDQESWARQWLLPGEVDLWERMSGPDRRHAAGVARDTAALLRRHEASEILEASRQADVERRAQSVPLYAPPRSVMAAALLHDVGKVESGLGTFSRVAVTLAAIAAGRDRLSAPLPAGAPRWRVRVRDYLVHDSIGAELLRAAGSDETTVAWTAEHHLPPERWTLDPAVAHALKEADGD